MTYILSGDDLLSKFGFGDGDIFDDQIYDYEEAANLKDRISSDAVLKAVVMKYLYPLLPNGIMIETINTHHNPIRLVQGSFRDIALITSIEIAVTKEQVEEVIKEVMGT